jgi:hypothetical protein
VVVVSAAVAVAAVVLALFVVLGGDDTETIGQRSDASCKKISDDLLAQGKPSAELYPTLRGMGCGKWLDEQFDKAGK